MRVGLIAAAHTAIVRFVGRVHVLVLLAIGTIGEASFTELTLERAFSTSEGCLARA